MHKKSLYSSFVFGCHSKATRSLVAIKDEANTSKKDGPFSTK